MEPGPAKPSDQLPSVLGIGRPDVRTAVVSMSARHPDGRDAEYLAWHALDHRPEQYRVAGLRGSWRLVSTPACRAARAASEPRYDRVDHLMTYVFVDRSDLVAFAALGAALHTGDRMPIRLPAVELGVHDLAGAVAAPRALVGADVVPWRPTLGAYVLVEQGTAPADELTEVPGVAGAWSFSGSPVAGVPAAMPVDDTEGLALTICYLDADPVETARLLDPTLQRRWQNGLVVPLLAAPFHSVVPFAWSRHVP